MLTMLVIKALLAIVAGVSINLFNKWDGDNYMNAYTKLMTTTRKLLLTTCLLFALGSTAAKADDVDVPYLTNLQIASQALLERVNTLFSYMTQLSTTAISWMNADNDPKNKPDWSTNWANEQNWLASLGAQNIQNEQDMYAMQTQLLNTFFNLPGNNQTPVNINDVVYPSMLQTPLINPDPRGNTVDSGMNYLKNASGLNIGITMPSSSFRGSEDNRNEYLKFYNTITAVQTYNLFALSHLYQDSKSDSSSRPLRQQLIAESSNSSWFTAVITNDLGWVLRQILLYSSQNYILMDQLVQINKQIAATLAMNNTLQMSNNYLQANTLLQKAQGLIEG